MLVKGILNRLKRLSVAQFFQIAWFLTALVVFLFVKAGVWRIVICSVWGVVALGVACRSQSALHNILAAPLNWRKGVIAAMVAVIVAACCVSPMGDLSLWNGEDPGHRNQYELMAEAILDGKLYLEYGGEDALAALDNPYDPDARAEAGISYQWDHAFYDGHYYMYFGVAPVFLAFLPYHVITGEPLTTYHATQAFVVMFVFGIFALFYLLSKLFFKKLPFAVYLALSVAFSVMSVWYSVAEPALYCTAITAAIALEVWSLFFFVKAVWGTKKENLQILYAAIGALLGALVFGCRPPIALANLLVIPMLIVFLRHHKFSFKLLFKLVLAALPYIIVAAALMLYNYARFDDPFEFGQAYQLTVADQSQYDFTLDSEMVLRIVNDTAKNFFGFSDVTASFPFLSHGGVFFNFPILLLSAVLLKSSVRKNLKQEKLSWVVYGLIAASLLITVMDIIWTPYLLERYRMDIYFLVGILCFICVGALHNVCDSKKRAVIHTLVLFLSVLTVVSSYLFYMREVEAYYPDVVKDAAQALFS